MYKKKEATVDILIIMINNWQNTAIIIGVVVFVAWLNLISHWIIRKSNGKNIIELLFVRTIMYIGLLISIDIAHVFTGDYEIMILKKKVDFFIVISFFLFLKELKSFMVNLSKMDFALSGLISMTNNITNSIESSMKGSSNNGDKKNKKVNKQILYPREIRTKAQTSRRSTGNVELPKKRRKRVKKEE